jgi:valyl-tRNA synthetase
MSDSQSHPSADGSRNKAKDEEKERKKAEKLRKFEEKNAKRAASQATSKPEKTKSKTISDVPVYNDPTIPGEKKILLDLDHASLRAYNPAAVESSHYAWWEKMNFFAPSPEFTDKSSADKPVVIIEPPPNVTGALHMGHALSGTLQDIMIR